MDPERRVPPPPASEALFEAHHAAILRLCRSYLRDDEEAEDAAQETFLAAHKSLLGGSAPQHEGAWLAAIARNACWQRLQRNARERLRTAELDAPPDVADAYTATIRRGEGDELRRALGELPTQQQKAFLLCEVAGHSYAEAASRLDVSEPAVDALLVRARRRLRQLLDMRLGGLQAVLGLGTGSAGSTVSGAAKIGAVSLTAKLTTAGIGATLLGGSLLAGGAIHSRPHHVVHRASQVHVSAAAPQHPVPTVRPTTHIGPPAGRDQPRETSESPVAERVQPEDQGGRGLTRNAEEQDGGDTEESSDGAIDHTKPAGFSSEERSMSLERHRISPANEGESD